MRALITLALTISLLAAGKAARVDAQIALPEFVIPDV
jgi:hypothetical protein